jgi:hypothetical protein
MGTRRSGRRASKLDKEDRGCMHGLVGCCYVPCDDDDESQGFVPVAGRCTTLRRDDESQGFVLAFWAPASAPSGHRLLHFFRVRGRRETIPAGVPASLRGGCGWNAATASERAERQVRGGSGAFYMP